MPNYYTQHLSRTVDLNNASLLIETTSGYMSVSVSR